MLSLPHFRRVFILFLAVSGPLSGGFEVVSAEDAPKGLQFIDIPVDRLLSVGDQLFGSVQVESWASERAASPPEFGDRVRAQRWNDTGQHLAFQVVATCTSRSATGWSEMSLRVEEVQGMGLPFGVAHVAGSIWTARRSGVGASIERVGGVASAGDESARCVGRWLRAAMTILTSADPLGLAKSNEQRDLLLGPTTLRPEESSRFMISRPERYSATPEMLVLGGSATCAEATAVSGVHGQTGKVDSQAKMEIVRTDSKGCGSEWARGTVAAVHVRTPSALLGLAPIGAHAFSSRSEFIWRGATTTLEEYWPTTTRATFQGGAARGAGAEQSKATVVRLRRSPGDAWWYAPGIGTENFVYTCAHWLAVGYDLEILSLSGEWSTAQICWSDPVIDIVCLAMAAERQPCAAPPRMRWECARTGATVRILTTSSEGLRTERKCTIGGVFLVPRVGACFLLLQSDPSDNASRVRMGDSGSAVIDASGMLIGCVTSGSDSDAVGVALGSQGLLEQWEGSNGLVSAETVSEVIDAVLEELRDLEAGEATLDVVMSRVKRVPNALRNAGVLALALEAAANAAQLPSLRELSAQFDPVRRGERRAQWYVARMRMRAARAQSQFEAAARAMRSAMGRYPECPDLWIEAAKFAKHWNPLLKVESVFSKASAFMKTEGDRIDLQFAESRYAK